MKIPNRNTLLALSLILAGMVPDRPISAQQHPPASADLDAIARQSFALDLAPGVAIAVEYKGKLVFSLGYGLSDIARHAPATPDTRFAIGSLSKQFVAVSVLMLAEQRKLSLDDPLAKYLPSLPNASKITVRMMLNQTSGLHNFPNTREHPWPMQGKIEPAVLFTLLATDKPDFEPGTRFEYSNTNYAALAEIVSKASGLSLASFLAHNIFTPLGMASSGSGDAAQRGIAHAYDGSAPYQPRKEVSLDLYLGAGSVVSTVIDLAKWDEALMQHKLLAPPSQQLLWTNATLPDGTSTGYAMGFIATTLDGHRELWHNGFVPGTGGYCFNAIFPDDGLAIAVLSNGAQFKGQPEAIVRRTLDTFFPPAADAAKPADSPREDPAVTALALTFYRQILSGTVDRSLLTAKAAEAFSPQVVVQAQAAFKQFGEPNKVTLQKRESIDGGTTCTYLASFASSDLHIVISIGSEGKISGYFLRP